MEYIKGLFTNYVLICAVSGWFAAQFIKCARYIFKNHRFDFAILMSSGGMPSSHSATVSSMVIATARNCGTDSVELALSAIPHLSLCTMRQESDVPLVNRQRF